ncbi:MAG: hypothetical protein ACWA6U_10960 [Breznakibacter sp.]
MEIMLVALGALTIVLWINAILDMNKTRFKHRNMSLVLLLMFAFPLVGPLAYFWLKRHFSQPRRFKVLMD